MGAMDTQLHLPLPAPLPSATLRINARCSVRTEGEHRLVVVGGLPAHHYSATDAIAEAYAMVFLVDAGYATQREVARAFRCSDRTVRRHQERYHDGGMAALATRSGWRPGRRRIPTRRIRVIERLRAEGLRNREIARRLGVTENAIRKQVGPSAAPQRQQSLLDDDSESPAIGSAVPPVEETAQKVAPTIPAPKVLEAAEESAPIAMSLDMDPSNRTWDRVLACCGLRDDATPIFGNTKGVAGAGILFAVPLLVASGIFQIAQKLYGEIGPAFYGTRTTLMSLLVMALGRIKRPEALKEHD